MSATETKVLHELRTLATLMKFEMLIHNVWPMIIHHFICLREEHTSFWPKKLVNTDDLEIVNPKIRKKKEREL